MLEKLKANRFQSKERKFVPKCRRKNLLGVFGMTGNFLSNFFVFSFFWGRDRGQGEKGWCQIQNVINEHLKKKLTVAAKRFK